MNPFACSAVISACAARPSHDSIAPLCTPMLCFPSLPCYRASPARLVVRYLKAYKTTRYYVLEFHCELSASLDSYLSQFCVFHVRVTTYARCVQKQAFSVSFSKNFSRSFPTKDYMRHYTIRWCGICEKSLRPL